MLQGLLIQSHVMSHVDVFAGGPNVWEESIFWERGLPGT